MEEQMYYEVEEDVIGEPIRESNRLFADDVLGSLDFDVNDIIDFSIL